MIRLIFALIGLFFQLISLLLTGTNVALKEVNKKLDEFDEEEEDEETRKAKERERAEAERKFKAAFEELEKIGEKVAKQSEVIIQPPATKPHIASAERLKPQNTAEVIEVKGSQSKLEPKVEAVRMAVAKVAEIQLSKTSPSVEPEISPAALAEALARKKQRQQLAIQLQNFNQERRTLEALPLHNPEQKQRLAELRALIAQHKNDLQALLETPQPVAAENTKGAKVVLAEEKEALPPRNQLKTVSYTPAREKCFGHKIEPQFRQCCRKISWKP